jgi:hypothetical protein
MATRKPLFFNSTEFASEEMAATDDILLGGLAMSGDITMASNEVTGLPATPSGDTAAASKAYVDSVASGLKWKEPARARAQGDVNLAAPGATIDGVSMGVDDRFLADQQSTGTEDGIYLWKGAATPAVRTADAQAGALFESVAIFISEGTVDADTAYVCTNDAGSDVVGTNPLTFVAFSSNVFTGGDGIDITSNVISVDLATISGLEFATGQLRVDVANTDELSIDANGLNVEGLPSLFKVNGVAVGAAVTAANLDTLTNGSNADALHVHAAAAATRLAEELTANEAITAGDPVEWSGTNNEIRQVRANAAARVDVFGVSEDAISASGSGTIIRRGVALGVLTAATAGTRYYAGDTGGLVSSIASISAGNHVIFIGTAKNADDLEVHPQYITKKAA